MDFKIIHKVIEIPIYYGELHVFITDNFKEANNKFKLAIPEDLLEGYDSIVDKFGSDGGPLKIYVLLRPETTFKIIAHESLHIVSHICLHTGIKGDFCNDEPLAYLLGWVSEKLLELFYNKKNIIYGLH